MAADRLGLRALGSALGLGYLPVAPGTWASMAAVGAYRLLRELPPTAARLALLAAFVAALSVGVAAGNRATKAFGDDDPGWFVLDELAGQWLVCLLFWWRGPWATALAAFVAFRFFDVVKPWPVRRLERLPGGWGVMMDDVAAAFLSAALLWPLCYGVADLAAG